MVSDSMVNETVVVSLPLVDFSIALGIGLGHYKDWMWKNAGGEPTS